MPEKDNDFVALKAFTKTEAKFDIGGKSYVMKPLVIKKVRKLIELIEKSGMEMQDFKTLKGVDKFVLNTITDLFPILFDSTIDKDFADDNISVPLCREIWETILKLNRLEDVLPFFGKIIKVKEEVPIREKKAS